MSNRRDHQENLFKKIYLSSYSPNTQYSLQNAVKGNKDTVQRLRLLRKLAVHNGCVNTISWSETGEYVLSGSDDQRLCVTNGNTYKVATTLQTGHRANIFSAKFLPNCNHKKVVSCSGDGIIMYTDIEHPEESLGNSFNCHFGTAYKIVTVPNDSNTFLSCGEDGTVRWYDLRMKQSCHVDDCQEDILINCRKAVTALAVNPITPYQLSVGSADSYVQIFDRRMIGTRATGNYRRDSMGALTRFTVPSFESRPHRITSLVYSSDANEMLVSYSSEYLYLFRLKGNEPSALSAYSSSAAELAAKSAVAPPMKRLRLRGDWSDTGPNARPERELQETRQRPSLHTSLMQRMSDVLTRMLSEPSRSRRGASNNSNNSTDNNITNDNNNNSEPVPVTGESSSLPGIGEESSNDSRPSVDSEAENTSQQPLEVLSEYPVQDVEPVILITPVQEVMGQDSISGHESVPIVGQEQLPSLSALPDTFTAVTSLDTFSADTLPDSFTGHILPDTSPAATPDSTVLEPCLQVTSCDTTSAETKTSETVDSVTCSSTSEIASVVVIPEAVINSAESTVVTADNSLTAEKVPLPEAATAVLPPSEDEACSSSACDTTSPPGKKVLQESLFSLEKELSSRRKHFLERHKMEPVISLHYSAQGSSSGLISMGMGRTPTSSDLDGPLPDSQTQEDEEGRTEPSSELSDPFTGGVDDRSSFYLVSQSPACLAASSDAPSEAEGLPMDISAPQVEEEEAVTSSCKEKPTRDEILPSTSDFAAAATSSDQKSREDDSPGSAPTFDDPSSFVSRSPDNDGDDSSESNLSSDDDEPQPWIACPHNLEMSRENTRSRASGELLHSADEIMVSPSDDSDTPLEKSFPLAPPPRLLNKFSGHRNARTMIKEANFWGEHFVMSGSDCGHIFFWDRYTAEVVMIVEADRHVVNCIQPHPYDPILASSGIDYDVKLWAPMHEEPSFDEKLASEIMRRNEVMLEETRDTITVPASFMIRMLASLNHLRTAGRRSQGGRTEAPTTDDSN